MKTDKKIEEVISEEVKPSVPQNDSGTKIVKSKTIEDLNNRLSKIEEFLNSDFRVGTTDYGFTPYNGHERSPGKFYSGTENPSTHATGFRLNYDGRFYATQMFSKAFFYVSDIAEKQNVVQLNDALDKLLSLRGVSFNWKNDNSADAGVIAQEVERAIPEAASNVDGRYGVKASTLIAYLIESIRELKNEIDELKNGKNIDSK